MKHICKYYYIDTNGIPLFTMVALPEENGRFPAVIYRSPYVDEYEEALIRVGKAEPIEILLNPGQVFRRGDRSPYLYLAQSMLTVLSEEYINLQKPDHTGVLDGITAESLADFQILTGLPSTGELDRKTWKHLAKHFTLSANRRSRFL